ncbi:MAG: type III-A CRISPR-associated RAMP protein Csm3 [Anaerolineae bacterium]|nr:type III-A CRISPR-associated RAMP protein Csm3 [Anaerolineae bacterium]
MDYQFLGKYLIRGEIYCVTGLHVGGTTTGVEIGGVDNPVIKDPLTDYPYIPGSSLKGKLRSLAEWSYGLVEKHSKHGGYSAYACSELEKEQQGARWDNVYALARLFGPASDNNTVRAAAGPTRLTVRDSFPTEVTKEEWESRLGEYIYTELKTENAIDRVTSEANPRPIERVPAGSAFDFEMIVDQYRKDEHLLLKELFGFMHLLEQSALGGSGSRGHGQVRFDKISIEWRPVAYYRKGTGAQVVDLKEIKTPAEIVKAFEQIQWPSAR